MKYKPPANTNYESPLEEVFAQHLTKYLKNPYKILEQFEVETICGNFRFDFVIMYNSKTIAFECDGQNYHDNNAQIYDFWRDSVLLAEGHAQQIFRLSGPVLMQKMEDVIFGGAKDHKPLGMAEVTITFENGDGSFPPAFQNYSELSITRRLYRSGDSEYRINNMPCRLKDIQDIFMDIFYK